jgi:hypothetical protein
MQLDPLWRGMADDGDWQRIELAAKEAKPDTDAGDRVRVWVDDERIERTLVTIIGEHSRAEMILADGGVFIGGSGWLHTSSMSFGEAVARLLRMMAARQAQYCQITVLMQSVAWQRGPGKHQGYLGPLSRLPASASRPAR